MLTKSLSYLLPLLLGAWMLTDGIHVLLHGKYIGPDKPGPWSLLFSSLQINPFSLGPLFILYGILWLALPLLQFANHPVPKPYPLFLALATLWYLPIGTILAIIYIAVILIA